MRHLRVLLILSLTQITGWGTVGALTVLAAPVAEEFGATLPEVFLATSLMFTAMGLAAPFAGRAFARFGARQVMGPGAALIGLGLGLAALAPGLVFFWLAWALTGAAGALFLTTAAYAYLADHAEAQARSLIGTLMLATGLAGSLFLPVTALLDHALGWRGCLLGYAALMVLAVAPLTRFGLPATAARPSETTPKGSGNMGRVFVLLVTAIALNSFVTFGVEYVGVELLRDLGMDLAAAVAIASLLGIFKVGGRLIDLLGGRRWDGLNTALVCGAMIPAGLGMLWLGGAGPWAVCGYLGLFGLGSGAFAVARATMPLVFYARADYAMAMSRIALPMNLINALAPPVLAGLMTAAGARAVFALLGAMSLAAFVLLLRLDGMRPRAEPA